jgi:hypothetical protein
VQEQPAAGGFEPASDQRYDEIIVTGSRIVRRDMISTVPVALIASAEQLGDLKLYRFPRAVTVASRAQKQVGMLSKPSVRLRPVYTAEVDGDRADTLLILRGKNITEQGLGIAMPGGKATIFATVDRQPLLVGESSIGDKTVGEDIEFALGSPDSVDTDVNAVREKGRVVRYDLVVTNANPWPIAYEAEFQIQTGATMRASGTRLGKKHGHPLWLTTVPANATARLSYAIKAAKDDAE